MFRSNKSIIESDIVEIRSLPQDFHTKLNDLELKLERGSLTHEGLKELFECYSVIILLFNDLLKRQLLVTMKQWILVIIFNFTLKKCKTC